MPKHTKKKVARKKSPKAKAAKVAAKPASKVEALIKKTVEAEATRRSKGRAFATSQLAEFRKRFPR